jgi:hypothetical protein
VDRNDHGLVEPFDSDLGSARVDRGEWRQPDHPENVRRGGHPEDAEAQTRPQPVEELVGTAGPNAGEPGDEHGSAGQDAGSMDDGTGDDGTGDDATAPDR